jgi:uncharacterized membrane protein
VSEHVTFIAEWAAAIIETIGIAVISVFAIYTLCLGLYRAVKGHANEGLFQEVRHRLGRGIMLGLEFLVAADIIHTVAVELTFETVGVLAVVVIIRTFLSFTLEAEISGRWPWQSPPAKWTVRGSDGREGVESER